MDAKTMQMAAGALYQALNPELVKTRYLSGPWMQIKEKLISPETAEKAAKIFNDLQEALDNEKKQPAAPVQADEWPAPKEKK